MPLEGLKHACGLYAIYAPGEPVAWMTAQALDGQQTRGQEGAGVATTDGDNFHIKKDRGLVIQVFRSPRSVRHLKGFAAIGHNRYSTTGRDKPCNVQPLRVSGPNGEICLGHNGNLVNALSLREELEADGETFETTTDSEVVAKLLVREPGEDWVSRLRGVMRKIEGAYNLTILTKDSVLLARDRTANRPLSIARMNGSWAAASESGIFNNQPLEFIRDVHPGEIILLNKDGMSSHVGLTPGPLGLCSFEWYYFARPDSEIHGVQTYDVRFRAGQTLARSYPADADWVVGVPRSGLYAADGYSVESGIYQVHGIVANLFYRAFIDPDQEERIRKLEKKYSTTNILRDKKVVIIDDSIVRGNSNERLVRVLRAAKILEAFGVHEIHIRSTYPPIVKPCRFGIDMATEGELIAARLGGDKEVVEEKLAQLWGVASVRYLSLQEAIDAVGLPEDVMCFDCVGGRSAIEIRGEVKKEAFERVPAAVSR